jgi:glyoxylase-like metal-dependent hydrolase (beta-lactamase superfamily II)
MLLKRSPYLIGFFMLLNFASASTGADSIQEVRIYALDCGRIDVRDMGSLFSDTGEYAGEPGAIADPCFLIQHPKGTLIWDTGLDDKIAESRGGIDVPAFGIHLSRSVKLADQLKELHLMPTDITYVAFSHFHFDHTSNAGLFSHSTWIINKAELANAQQAPVPSGIDPAIASEIDTAKVQMIDGDYDVFGDGTVRILKTPGHTPGHQSLEIKLKNSGTVLLTGDLYHLRNNRELRLVPPVNSERADTLASMDRFERIAKNTRARVVIQPDEQDFRSLPRFPAHLN